MNRIALVEDHERLSSIVQRAVGAAGVMVDAFERIDTAWAAIAQVAYGAIVVDRGLPDGDGLELVRRLRAAGNVTPCLMLTARDALHDRVEGLEMGADDYLVKPFPMEELVARVRALLRRPAAMQSLSPTFGDLSVLPEAGLLCCGEQSVAVSATELQITLSLVRAAGRTVRRSALESAAWGLSDAVTPNALDVAMHRVRRKLVALGSRVQVVNARGHGYALVSA